MNKYNPNIHHRRSIRLKMYDYSQAGLYFITICCQHRICRFGKIKNGGMILNEFGIIAHTEWMQLEKRFQNFELDVFQIMPNHIHGIIALVGSTLAVDPNEIRNAVDPNEIRNAVDPNEIRNAVDPNEICDDPVVMLLSTANHHGSTVNHHGSTVNHHGSTARVDPTRTTVGDIVGAYKSIVTTKCLELYKSKNKQMGKLWQRNYYEHIIRNPKSYNIISNYIMNNPSKWERDLFNK